MGENDGRKAYRSICRAQEDRASRRSQCQWALGIWERQRRGLFLWKLGDMAPGPITPASWARIKAAGTAVMGSPPAALLMGPVPGDLQGLAEGSSTDKQEEGESHCTLKSRRPEAREEPRSRAGVMPMPVHLLPALVLEGRSHTTGPQSRSSPPPMKASLAQP